jgi:predicted lipoprotein
MNNTIKYILILLAVGLVGYKSVYFKKLSGVKKKTDKKFDAATYSKKLWEERLPAKLDSAIELTTLIKAIEANPADAFAKYSDAIGIGNYRYSLVKVSGVAAVINEDEITVQVNHADSLLITRLATEYVYGNAIRDASSLVDIKDFTNTADLNSISEELNKTVRTTLLPSFKKQVKQGDKIEITAAVEFNKEHISFSNLELIPVRLKIVQ